MLIDIGQALYGALHCMDDRILLRRTSHASSRDRDSVSVAVYVDATEYYPGEMEREADATG